MNNPLISHWRRRHFWAAVDWLDEWQWEWLGTFTFENNISINNVNHYLHSWVRKLQTLEHLQVAYMGIACWKKKHPHVHLLLLGRGNYQQRFVYLRNINTSVWERQWPFIAQVKTIDDRERAIKYLAAHCFRSKCDEYELVDYNAKLLQRCSMRSGFVG
ncbi:hypothetical protein [Desulfoferula mesophila]|uniref:hypothetical protein n=1 Tax=Desulfoferula mesophila TaxID=3058419 RepID=UPI0030D2D32F